MKKPYFPLVEGAPLPLRKIVKREVRFEEVDALGIVWHGRYPSYFEDARVALGYKFGIGYMELYENGISAPIKQLHIDYHRPLKFREEFTIEGILHWTEAAKINCEFIIRDSKDRIATTGYSVQLMLNRNNELFMVHPPFLEELRKKWNAGELE